MDQRQRQEWKIKERHWVSQYMSVSKQTEWNIGYFRDTMKRPTLRTVSIEEGEECHGEDTVNIFSKIIQETFPNLEKKIPIHV